MSVGNSYVYDLHSFTVSLAQLTYSPAVGFLLSPVTGIPEPTRAYTLTSVTNHLWYNVTLNAMLDGTPTLTDTTTVMPTDLFVCLAPILRDAAQ